MALRPPAMRHPTAGGIGAPRTTRGGDEPPPSVAPHRRARGWLDELPALVGQDTPLMKAGTILIADDEPAIREALSRLIDLEGYQPLKAADGEEALAQITAHSPDVVLLDIHMPGLNGLAVLRAVRLADPDLPVIVITGDGLPQTAVSAMRSGAYDYIVKPFKHVDVLRCLTSAMVERKAHLAARDPRARKGAPRSLRELMGPSAAVQRIADQVLRVAPSDFTVLVLGETGTGKEIVARAIHDGSRRGAGPFVPIDCGAIQEGLFENELFGHEKGAYTGSDRATRGKFEAAKGGSLILDEVSNMPVGSQAKLLRAVQERKVYPIGANHPVSIDVRLIALSNEDLECVVARHGFRADLFFRLNEFTIRIPALRDRREDVVYLAKRFLDRANQELQKSVASLTAAAVERLATYHWPGNVRQLRSVIRRGVLLADEVIDVEHLGLSEIATPATEVPGEESVDGRAQNGVALRVRVRHATIAVERAALIEAVRASSGNKAKAARSLQIDYKTMQAKLREYGLITPESTDAEKQGSRTVR
jgi:two-component system nitrogen regulation response regulator GlnG